MSEETNTDRTEATSIDEICERVKNPRTITLDVDRYQKYLDDADLSEAQKRDVLEALWSIIVNFVDLGFGVHPLQQACGKPPEISRKSSKRAADMVSCEDHLNQEFKSVTAQHCCNNARE